MSHHFSFYGNRGHHYVVFSQLRGGPVIAEICIRNSGAVVSRGICCAAHSLTGASLTHTSAHRAGGGGGAWERRLQSYWWMVGLDDRRETSGKRTRTV